MKIYIKEFNQLNRLLYKFLNEYESFILLKKMGIHDLENHSIYKVERNIFNILERRSFANSIFIKHYLINFYEFHKLDKQKFVIKIMQGYKVRFDMVIYDMDM